MEKYKLKKPIINLQILLIAIMLIICLIPAIVYGRILTQSFANAEIEERRISLRARALIITDNISNTGYLTQAYNEENKLLFTGIDSDIRNLADMYSGRVVIVNKNYRIIKDTFNLSLGKFHLANEVVKSFNGEYTNSYNGEYHYILQTFPIYGEVYEQVVSDDEVGLTKVNENPKEVVGVMLIYSSTRGEMIILEETREKMIMLEIILALCVAGAAMIVVSFLLRPLFKLDEAIFAASEGNFGTVVHIDTYDLTKRISTNINNIFRKLKELNTTRDEFVANVSHELKTPITSIRVLADSLMGMDDVPVQMYQEFMEDISNEIDRESKIIDDLLSLVRLDKPDMELNTSQININILIESIIKRLTPIAGMRKIVIEFESFREVEAEVDETKISLAISNVIENAIKYNKEEGWVRVILESDHKFFYLKIMDSGVGIPQELRESIFERFYRVDKARSRDTGGTGLGLAITRNIIRKHMGIIYVTDGKNDEGTCFVIRVPLTYRRKG